MLKARKNNLSLCCDWENVGAWLCDAKITGILVDAYSHLDQAGYHNFGVVEEPLQTQLGNDDIPTLEPIETLTMHNEARFPVQRLTTGSLHDVTGLQVRRRKGRCLGLRIMHGNQLDDYLGYWDPLDTRSIDTIYGLDQGSLKALRFHVVVDRKHGPYVSDISTCLEAANQRQGASEYGLAEDSKCQKAPGDDLTEEGRRESSSAAKLSNNPLQFNCGEIGKVRLSRL